MCVSIIFGTVNAVTKIGEYLKLIDSVNSKLDRLTGMHLKAANYALDSALRTTNKEEYSKYIERAINKFIDAISVEKKEVKLIQAHFGLAFCNHLMGDTSNMLINIKEIKFHYGVLCNMIPDEDSILQKMSEEGNGEGGMMEKTILSVISLGSIPLISGVVEAIKKPIKSHITKEIESVKPIIIEMEKIKIEYLPESFSSNT